MFLDEREYADDGDDDRTCKLFGNRILNKLVDEAGFFVVGGCPTTLGNQCLLVLVLFQSVASLFLMLLF